MTLKLRNRLFLVLLIFSLLCIMAAAVPLIVAAISHAILPPPQVRIPKFLNYLPFAPYSFTATMLSISLLVVYVPITIFLMYRAFENTQTSEVIFFAGFLMSCLCEGSRILIPLFSLGQSFSQLQLFSGRILLLGRFLAPLSLIVASIMSETEQRQDIERNFMIMLAVSTLFALVIPLNTAELSSSCTIRWGFPRLIAIMNLLLSVTAVVSFWINSIKHDSKEFKKVAFAVIILLAGYNLLCIADNYVCLAAGAALLTTGTQTMLYNLHKLYMWQ
ncbi:MAG: hypothetical protein K6G80_10595 [Treponema sp.]|nr:hypothetical protein [Treponema sp.]